MIKVTLNRPNTIGTYLTKEFETFKDAEQFIESRCESLANRGWELSEIKGSSSKAGVVECTHDFEADVLLIEWRRL